MTLPAPRYVLMDTSGRWLTVRIGLDTFHGDDAHRLQQQYGGGVPAGTLKMLALAPEEANAASAAGLTQGGNRLVRPVKCETGEPYTVGFDKHGEPEKRPVEGQAS